MRTRGASSRIGRLRGEGLVCIELICEMQGLDLRVRQRVRLAACQPIPQLIALCENELQRLEQSVLALEIVAFGGESELAFDCLRQHRQVFMAAARAVE